jgi:hypothetical protein
VISHVYEVSAGVDCGGEKKKHPWFVHGCFSPKFVYQNALHGMVGHFASHPSELMDYFPSARQCHPGTKRTCASMTRRSLWQFWFCPLPYRIAPVLRVGTGKVKRLVKKPPP